MRSNVWSDEELIVACYIYNSDWSYTEKIRRALQYLGRNESSVKFRFGNFDNFRKGAGGFANGGTHARKIWDKYQENPSEMAELAISLFNGGQVGSASNSESEMATELGVFDIEEGSYREYISKYRKNQDKLRAATLTCAGNRCCVTGISEPMFLIASHIKPWSVCEPKEKTDVHNALCLNTFHDSLFDKYRMTVNESMEIIYDPKLEDCIPEKTYRSMIQEYTEIKVNESNKPATKYLEYHNNRFTAITGIKV